jgi:DNA invertase Pin-like site-specific DNA recombinase
LEAIRDDHSKTEAEKNKNLIALIYTRVSTLQQQTDGTGNKSQEIRCRELAEKEGWQVEQVFPDTFTGAGDFMKRPAMRELLAHIEKNKFKNYVVIFDDLKRLSRDTKEYLNLRLAFKASGTELRCLNFNFEDSPEGEFIETIIAATGQLERKQNKRQVIQKQRARMIAGYWPHRAFFGYDQVKVPGQGKVSVQNKFAPIVKEAIEGYAYGRFKNLTEVGKFMQENGVGGRSSEKRLCMTSTGILTNIFYAGFINYPEYDVKMVPGKHVPLVSLETFDKVQEKLNARYRDERDYQIYRPEFELRGIVRCRDCKNKLRSYKTTKHRKSGHVQINMYYECKNNGCVNYGKVSRANDLHSKFFCHLEKIVPTKEAVEIGMDAFKEAFEEFKNELKLKSGSEVENIATIEKQIEHLVELTSSQLSPTLLQTYQNKLEKLILEKKKLEEQGTNLIDMEIVSRTSMEKMFDLINSPYSIWVKCTPEKKKIFYNFVFAEDFFVGPNYECRTPVTSPIYHYLQEFSGISKKNFTEKNNLWTNHSISCTRKLTLLP